MLSTSSLLPVPAALPTFVAAFTSPTFPVDPTIFVLPISPFLPSPPFISTSSSSSFSSYSASSCSSNYCLSCWRSWSDKSLFILSCYFLLFFDWRISCRFFIRFVTNFLALFISCRCVNVNSGCFGSGSKFNAL